METHKQEWVEEYAKGFKKYWDTALESLVGDVQEHMDCDQTDALFALMLDTLIRMDARNQKMMQYYEQMIGPDEEWKE